MLEASVDDLKTEYLPLIFDEFLKKGALDVYSVPVQMKKGRWGFVISVICREDKEKALEEVFFNSTSTIGIRKYKVERCELERKVANFEFSLGSVRVKLGYYEGRLVNFKPEFEDIKTLSAKKGLSHKRVLDIFNNEFKHKDF